MRPRLERFKGTVPRPASILAEMGISFDAIAIVVGHDAGSRQTRTLIRHYVLHHPLHAVPGEARRGGNRQG